MKNTASRRSKWIQLAVPASLLVGIGWLLWSNKVAPTAPVASSIEPPAPEQAQSTTDPAADPAAEPVAETVTPVASVSPLETQWGIQVQSLSLSKNQTSVQLRYTVVAPEKTHLLAETNTTAYLVNQADGAKLSMITTPPDGDFPQGASARTNRRMMKQAGQFPPAPNRLLAGQTYSLQIPNWGQALRSGSLVSLVVGDCRQDGLRVE